MASNSILKLQVDDKQYEASLKNAQQGLKALQDALRNSGKSFADVDKQTEEYVRALGKMSTTAKTARGGIGEMSSAFVELSRVEKQLTDQERQSPVGKALTESLAQLKQRTIDAKNELQGLENQIKNVGEVKLPDVGGGGLFSGDKLSGMLQVFGGNLMTKGLELATGAVSSLASEIGGMITQGVELAKQGEGIRIAFQRLGRGDILDGLREATHNTVTDIELMKAAVKFNDFKLPLDELGTMLAFAQQKAKDTGQSVDYMVDSIVTGLGRKSLMILDNLGLSATEIRERMKETGDMTKAVGAIIREQMAAAGDYVETAADRALQANVSLQNKMEELGRKFAPVEEASNQLWTSMKIGILDIIGGPLATLLNQLTEAGRLKNALNDVNGGGNGGETRTEKALRLLREYSGGGRGLEGKRDLYNRQMSSFNQQEQNAWRESQRLSNQLRGYERQVRDDPTRSSDLKPFINDLTRRVEAAENRAKAIQIMRSNYEKGAKDILEPKAAPTTPQTPTTTTPKGAKTTKDAEKDDKFMAEWRKAEAKAAKAVQLYEGEVLTSAEVEKKQQESARELEKSQKKLADEQKKRAELEASWKTPSTGAMSSLEQDLKKRQSTTAVGSSEFNSLQNNIVDINTLQSVINAQIKNGLKIDHDVSASLMAQIVSGDNITDDVWQGVIDKINEKLKEMNVEPIQIDFKTGDTKKQSKEMSKDWKEAAQAINAVGSAMSQIEDPAAKIVGTIGMAIANIALGFAQATAKDSKLGVFGWIAAIAGGLATMVSTIAAIHSATGYANGGMVKGNSYSGDNLMAQGPDGGLIGLNAGEVVLNRSQVAGLSRELQNGGGQGNMSIVGVLRGEDVALMVDRYGRRTGKGELLFAKNL